MEKKGKVRQVVRRGIMEWKMTEKNEKRKERERKVSKEDRRWMLGGDLKWRKERKRYVGRERNVKNRVSIKE